MLRGLKQESEKQSTASILKVPNSAFQIPLSSSELLRYKFLYASTIVSFQKIISELHHIIQKHRHLPTMHSDQQPIVMESVAYDEHLSNLFCCFETAAKDSRIHTSMNNHSEEPAHYDVKDIQRDYNSECPKGKHRIRKNKKRKIVTNLVAKARKQRKNKLYIQMLQNRIFEYQRQVQALRRTNNAQKQSLKKKNDAEHIVNGLFVNRQRHYEKLHTYIKQTNIDEQKFMEEYGILRLRQGAVGKDRIRVINYYFKELTEIMIPDLQKYIIKTVQQESDLFDSHFIQHGVMGAEVEQWRKDMIADLQLSHQKIASISTLKDEILREKNNLQNYIEEFYKIKCQIVAVSRQIEMTYDRANSILSPREIAKCLCLIEKYKFQKGFSVQDLFKQTFFKLQQEQKECYNPQNLYEFA